MRQFEIPEFYRSPIISRVKAKRKLEDPRKVDFSPSMLDFGTVKFYIARHFGFCYGVENAIEISYKAIAENPDKRIFLLGQMIHNPEVNADLKSYGIRFIQDTDGSQLIPWSEINADDIVIIPAFGTTVEIESILTGIGVDVKKYNTTCPFVEKVWNRSDKLGQDQHTIIIHGKYNHEETRATFSHSLQNSKALIIKDIEETRFLADVILGKRTSDEFLRFFEGKYSSGFNPDVDLQKIGVVNQTTMLATETQEITDFLRSVMVEKYGADHVKQHIADTRDTLCYATNDNQSATNGLLNSNADLALVVGGYNSSNTTHLVEILEQKFPTYFVQSHEEINSSIQIQSYDIHKKELKVVSDFLPLKNQPIHIALTSGASCPDAIVDRVIQRIVSLLDCPVSVEQAIDQFVNQSI